VYTCDIESIGDWGSHVFTIPVCAGISSFYIHQRFSVYCYLWSLSVVKSVFFLLFLATCLLCWITQFNDRLRKK